MVVSGGEDLARWDQVAGVYARTVGGEGDSFYRRFAPFLWRELGDIQGQRVLDLGCGHGWLAAKLHQAGADVIGIDGSTELIATARATYPDLDFQVHNLTSGLPPSPGAYDRVVSHMVLMDIADLTPMLADVATALRPDGVFVFSILHPCFFDQVPAQDPDTGRWERRVRGYLDHEQRWIESFGGHTHYHRPLSWYLDQLAENNLAVTRLHEPLTLPNHTRPPDEWTDYERWFATIPTMLAISCRPLTTT